MENFNEIANRFIASGEEIMDVTSCAEIPEEIRDEDIYTYSYLFRDEETAFNFLVNDQVSSNYTYEELRKMFEEEKVGLLPNDCPYLELHSLKHGNCLFQLKNGCFLLAELF